MNAHYFPPDAYVQRTVRRRRLQRHEIRRALSSGLLYWKTPSDRYYAACVHCMQYAEQMPPGEIAPWWERHFASEWHQDQVAHKQTERAFFDALDNALTGGSNGAA